MCLGGLVAVLCSFPGSYLLSFLLRAWLNPLPLSHLFFTMPARPRDLRNRLLPLSGVFLFGWWLFVVWGLLSRCWNATCLATPS